MRIVYLHKVKFPENGYWKIHLSFRNLYWRMFSKLLNKKKTSSSLLKMSDSIFLLNKTKLRKELFFSWKKGSCCKNRKNISLNMFSITSFNIYISTVQNWINKKTSQKPTPNLLWHFFMLKSEFYPNLSQFSSSTLPENIRNQRFPNVLWEL